MIGDEFFQITKVAASYKFCHTYFQSQWKILISARCVSQIDTIIWENSPDDQSTPQIQVIKTPEMKEFANVYVFLLIFHTCCVANDLILMYNNSALISFDNFVMQFWFNMKLSEMIKSLNKSLQLPVWRIGVNEKVLVYTMAVKKLCRRQSYEPIIR